MESLANEIKVEILCYVSVYDVLHNIQMLNKTWYSVCQENILWYKLFQGFIRDSQNCISFRDSYSLYNLNDLSDWKEYFQYFYRHNMKNQAPYLPAVPDTEYNSEESDEENSKNEENSQFQEDIETTEFIESKYFYEPKLSVMLKVQILFLGDIEGKMENLFYHLKFSQSWVGIYYLRTFGETLLLTLRNPALHLFLNCWRLHESIETTIEFTESSNLYYGISSDEKLGRAIITCLGHDSLQKLIQMDGLSTNSNFECHESLETIFQAIASLRKVLQNPEYAPVPLLLFLHSETASKMSPSEYSSIIHFLGLSSSKRLWRISCANFNSMNMIGVYGSLEWLYNILHAKQQSEK